MSSFLWCSFASFFLYFPVEPRRKTSFTSVTLAILCRMRVRLSVLAGAERTISTREAAQDEAGAREKRTSGLSRIRRLELVTTLAREPVTSNESLGTIGDLNTQETFTFEFIRKVGDTCDVIDADDKVNTQTEIQDKL